MRYLIVGNQTLAGDALRAAVMERDRASPASFHVVVPATPTRDHLMWSEGEASVVALRRLDDALGWMRAVDATATGEVGDASPALAVADALLHGEFDEILVSTLPAGPSRWIRQDLPRRLARRTGLPVTHVVAADARQPEGSTR
jgi:hypothetical protein